MRSLRSSLLASAVLFLTIPSGLAQPARGISQANNQFAFDLYSRLDHKEGNIFFSPYSLTNALTMTYEGARGQTADEMRMSLYLPSDEIDWRSDLSGFIQSMNVTDGPYELSTANALWTQKAFPFKEDYLKLIKETYFAQARNLDFKTDPDDSRVIINNWVSDRTKDRIKGLLPEGSITPDTRLVLTDAVYFKGTWEVPFEKADTGPDAFWTTPDRSVQVDMMRMYEKSFNYSENDQAQVLQIPYKGNGLSMFIVLPRSKDIQSLEKILNQNILEQWQEEMMPQKVDVYLPKFKFDSNYKMKEILIDLGMKLAFDKLNADFSGMAILKPGEVLYIDQVYHKAWIDVDEQGTEAAAATAVVMAVASGMPVGPIIQPKVFRADHPFIFVIQDNKTGHILFMGRVSDPRQK